MQVNVGGSMHKQRECSSRPLSSRRFHYDIILPLWHRQMIKKKLQETFFLFLFSKLHFSCSIRKHIPTSARLSLKTLTLSSDTLIEHFDTLMEHFEWSVSFFYGMENFQMVTLANNLVNKKSFKPITNKLMVSGSIKLIFSSYLSQSGTLFLWHFVPGLDLQVQCSITRKPKQNKIFTFSLKVK